MFEFCACSPGAGGCVGGARLEEREAELPKRVGGTSVTGDGDSEVIKDGKFFHGMVRLHLCLKHL